MRQLQLDAHHPVTLSNIEYIEFSFNRISPTIEPPLLFPEFDVNIIESRLDGERVGFLIMQVATRPLPEMKSGDQIPEDLPVLQFSFTVFAHFQCAEFEGAQNVMKTFMESESDTPALIVWPYVRGFVADMVNRAGLPGYHLPLLQIRTPQIGPISPNALEK